MSAAGGSPWDAVSLEGGGDEMQLGEIWGRRGGTEDPCSWVKSTELPPLAECCWPGSGLGLSPAALPSSLAVFSPLLPGSELTARRRCTAINYSTTALGEVSKEKWTGETLLNLPTPPPSHVHGGGGMKGQVERTVGWE